jgi:hypothetical protein
MPHWIQKINAYDPLTSLRAVSLALQYRAEFSDRARFTFSCHINPASSEISLGGEIHNPTLENSRRGREL